MRLAQIRKMTYRFLTPAVERSVHLPLGSRNQSKKGTHHVSKTLVLLEPYPPSTPSLPNLEKGKLTSVEG
jgi:hypothetical protein